MSSPTVQQIALRMLRYIGVTQFTPQAPGSELESLNPGDLEDVANAITGALQEIAALGPAEAREAPGYAVLHAPANITFTAANGSNVISGVSGWQSWMQGCTVRVSGDDQDNEILSQTRLARAYLGGTGSVGATVYGDTITLDDTVAKVIAPLWLPNQLPLHPAQNRREFMRLGGYPLITDTNGLAAGLPFYLYYRKPVSRPWTWFIDAAYDASLGYTQRRIRFSPMPAQAYSVAYTAAMNPPRVTKADIVSPLTTLQASGAAGGDTNANQTYTYAANFAGFRMFAGDTHPAYAIYYNPADNCYVVNNGLVATSLAAANHWASAVVNSPLGTFNTVNSASGTVTITTTDAGNGAADPGTVLPIPNAWVESILLPVALMRFSGCAAFKNTSALPEITRQYKAAVASLRDSRGQESVARARYI
jgi:hypothetical protein